MVDITLTLKGPVDCKKLATIAFYRANGEVAELQETVGNCATLPPPAPKCNNGKDDDAQDCSVTAGTAGASFALTNQDTTLGRHLAADASCRPVTVALLREDGSVWADRVDFC